MYGEEDPNTNTFGHGWSTPRLQLLNETDRTTMGCLLCMRIPCGCRCGLCRLFVIMGAHE